MADYKKLEEAENINLERPNTYADQLDAAVANTGKPYQYDFNADQLYQDYKKGYMTEAQKARANVINAGKQYTAAYPDTYVDSAANQQYQTYLAEINRLAPAFENLAWSQHQLENDEAIRQAQILQGLDSTEYGRYRDALNDLYNNRKYELGNYKYDVGLENEQKAFADKVDTANKNYEQQLYKDRLAELAASISASRGGGGGGGRRGGGGGGGGDYPSSGGEYLMNSHNGTDTNPSKIVVYGYNKLSMTDIAMYEQIGAIKEVTDGKGGHGFVAVAPKYAADKAIKNYQRLVAQQTAGKNYKR